MKPLRPVDAQYPMIQGWMEHPENYPQNGGHKGFDYQCPVGTPDYACADGVIEFMGYRPSSGYGREIVLRINEHITVVYGHHSGYKVYTGQKVKRGDVIGLTGGDPNDSDPIDGYSLGAHLHFEPRIDNVPINPAIFFEMDLPGGEELSKPITKSVTVVTNSVKVRRSPNMDRDAIGMVFRGETFETAGDPLPGTGIVTAWQPVIVYIGVGVDGEMYIK